MGGGERGGACRSRVSPVSSGSIRRRRRSSVFQCAHTLTKKKKQQRGNISTHTYSEISVSHRDGKDFFGL